MTSLATIHLEQKILCTPKASYHIAERASLAKRMKLVSLDRGLLAISSYEDDIREISKYLKARTVAKRTYPLADAAEQNLRMKPDHQLLCVKGNISVSIGSGSATTRYCFSDDQTQHNLKGYTGFIIFQDKGWMFRRFVFHFKFYYGDPCLPGLGTRFNLRFPRVIMPNSPWHQAVQNGDMPALKQWILSRKVSVSDVTVHGDTLLHVSLV
jgi:hypothetical protein